MESRLTGKAFLPEDPHSKDRFVCSQCGTALFEAAAKFDAGCGFPSFWKHNGNDVRQNLLTTYGRQRIQLRCNTCWQHLGHLFESKITPTGVRYCINAQAIVRKAQ